MLHEEGAASRRLKNERIDADLVIIGGGMAGTCCAITAARAGIKVVLVQDRPVLGGNASSEFRLWMLGATSHMGNNNRWAREGGVVDEIMVENTFRNPQGNAVILDTILLEKCYEEPNLRLLLNTAAYEVEKDGDRISKVRAFCSQNSVQYDLVATNYCDASGDGVVGFLAGAAFRMGAESKVEFGERLAPAEDIRQLLGHSLYFYTRDTGQPIDFVAPSYALDDISKIPRYRNFNTKEHGCQLWWIEWGGRLDTVHDTEEIKWELWKIVYGVWDHIKNSGEFPEAETMTLDWVGLIPGKRESRRFEGDYILVQQDIVEQREHYDAVSFGGWAIDLHPVDGVYSSEDPCNQWHSKGVYQIPYRCMYSKNVTNLFLAGRIISASHIAFGSTRVMATCAHNAQAVGMAAALCSQNDLTPRGLAHPDRIIELQKRLLRSGQHIPGIEQTDDLDLCQNATITASSAFSLSAVPMNGTLADLASPRAIMLPLRAGRVPRLSLHVQADRRTQLTVQLRVSSSSNGYTFTPDAILESLTVAVGEDSDESIAADTIELGYSSDESGAVTEKLMEPHTHLNEVVMVQFDATLPSQCFCFICIMANPHVRIGKSDLIAPGITSLFHRKDERVAKSSVQQAPPNSGIDTFEFWTPERRPLGGNLAIDCNPPLESFGPENLLNGKLRPANGNANAWVAAPNDPSPMVCLCWDEPVKISRIELTFDTDLDHPMESVHMRHNESVMPQCVREIRVLDVDGTELFHCTDNHQTQLRHSTCGFRYSQPGSFWKYRIRPHPFPPICLRFAVTLDCAKRSKLDMTMKTFG